MSITTQFDRFGKGFKKGAVQLGKKIGRGIKTTAKFVAEKALPVVEKVSGIVATGLKYAMPVITALAPEFAPLAVGALAASQAINSAAKGARKVITVGNSAIELGKKAESFIEKPSIGTGMSLLNQGKESAPIFKSAVMPPPQMRLRAVPL